MDYMAILGCNCLLKRRIHAGRLFAVSLIFSLFHLFLVCFIRNRILYLLIAHFVLNTGMVFLCFGWEGKRSYLENWVVTYFMCVIQGGALEWLLEQQIFTQNEVLQIFVVTAAVVTAVICFGERRIYGNHIYPAELKKGEIPSISATSFCVFSSPSIVFNPNRSSMIIRSLPESFPIAVLSSRCSTSVSMSW